MGEYSDFDPKVDVSEALKRDLVSQLFFIESSVGPLYLTEQSLQSLAPTRRVPGRAKKAYGTVNAPRIIWPIAARGVAARAHAAQTRVLHRAEARAHPAPLRVYRYHDTREEGSETYTLKVPPRPDNEHPWLHVSRARSTASAHAREEDDH